MRLFHREFGNQGQPLIILHGLFGISDNWVSFARKISDSYHVFIPDQRNHGQSQHCDLFNYDVLTDDIYEFITEHNLDDPIILGHSMGGKVAMQFALKYPELTPAIIIADISMRAYENNRHHEKFIAAMRSIDFQSIKYRSEIEASLSKTIPSARIRQFLLKNIHRNEEGALNWRIHLDGIEKNLDAIFTAIDSTKTYNAPALFIHGGASSYVQESDKPEIQKAFTQAEFEMIAHATHWLHADEPEKFLNIVVNFLKKIEA